jgi:hypothetical protein
VKEKERNGQDREKMNNKRITFMKKRGKPREKTV